MIFDDLGDAATFEMTMNDDYIQDRKRGWWTIGRAIGKGIQVRLLNNTEFLLNS